METKIETQMNAPPKRGRTRLSRGRVLVLAIALGLLMATSAWMWRMRGLDGLPDVGDPFDISETLRPIEISDDNNAYVDYSKAQRLLTKMPDPVRQVDWSKMSWAMANPDVRAYLEVN